MGKVIKFQSKKESINNEEANISNAKENLEAQKTLKTFGLSDFELSLRKAIEDYILSVFAVKQILGMDIVYKEHKSNIGVIGVVAYEHKRRPGTFVANFICEAVREKDNIRVIEIAFEAGEPELYRSIYNTLKAKKALPEV